MTGNKYLLDSNAIIAYLKADETIIDLLKEKIITIPNIVVGELYYGAYKSNQVEQNIARLKNFLAGRSILFCDLVTAEYYGRVHIELRQKGRPIPTNDIWIAALTVQHKQTIVTRDQHFSEINNLQIQSW